MSIQTRRIRALIKEKGMTQKAVLERIGAPRDSYFSDVDRGTGNMPEHMLDKAAEVLGTTKEYLKGETDNPYPLPGIDILPEDMVVIDLVATVAAGYDHGADTDIIEQVAVPSFMLKGFPPSECKMITVKGDSMWPRFGNGDRAIFHLQTSVDSGSIAVIQVNGDEYTLKRVTYVTGEDWFKLEPINPAFPVKKVEGADMQDCRIIGLVLSSLRVE